MDVAISYSDARRTAPMVEDLVARLLSSLAGRLPKELLVSAALGLGAGEPGVVEAGGGMLPGLPPARGHAPVRPRVRDVAAFQNGTVMVCSLPK